MRTDSLVRITVLLGSIVAFAAAPAGQGTSAPRERLLWDRAVELWGTTTRDGRLLSFPDWTTGDLGVRDLVAGESRRITDKGGLMELHLVPMANGRAAGDARKIHTVTSIGHALSMTPDGRLIPGRGKRYVEAMFASLDPATGAVGPWRRRGLSFHLAPAVWGAASASHPTAGM